MAWLTPKPSELAKKYDDKNAVVKFNHIGNFKVFSTNFFRPKLRVYFLTFFPVTKSDIVKAIHF